MASNVFSLEDYYRTQPPQYLAQDKVDQVLEYLAFSGTPIFLSIEKSGERIQRLEKPSTILDVYDSGFIVDCSELRLKGDDSSTITVSFGYKRKRAFFKTKIDRCENENWYFKKPDSVTLTNLRRNPRVAIEQTLNAKGLEVRIKANTAVGALDIKKAIPKEMSQLGLSIFIDRAEGLVLPGDKIESLEFSLHGQPVFRTSGVVSRVDMKKRAAELPQSYEVIVLFRSKETKVSNVPVARSAKRIPILDEKPCYFTAEHPFFPGRKIQGQVFEISTSGLSCLLEKTSFPVIAGMRFHHCSLQLPHRPSREFVFEVAHVEFRSDGQILEFKLGGEFVQASIELIKDVTAYAQEAAGNLVQDVTEEDLDLLWEFMFETNFIYQDKRRMLQSRSREILETYHRLLSTDNPIVKKLVVKEKQEIKGHVSAIHYYDYAWIIQHLNAIKSNSSSAAQQVVSAVVNFFYDAKAMQKADIFYVMSFYRPNNLYPAVLFGESTRRIADPLKSCAFDFSYGLYQNHEDLKPSEDLVSRIMENNADDMLALSNHLIEKNMISFMRACGLSQPSDLDLRLKKTYENLNLFRDRKLLSIKVDDHRVYAIVDLSSVGLNLSELTNAILLFSEGEQMDLISEMGTALVQSAYQKFFEPRGIVPVVLQLPDGAKPSNVNRSKNYTCWITSALGVAEFEKHSKTVIADFKELLSSYKKQLDEESSKSQTA